MNQISDFKINDQPVAQSFVKPAQRMFSDPTGRCSCWWPAFRRWSSAALFNNIRPPLDQPDAFRVAIFTPHPGMEMNNGSPSLLSISDGRFTERSKISSIRKASASPAKMPLTARPAHFFLEFFRPPFLRRRWRLDDADVRSLALVQRFVNVGSFQMVCEVFQIGFHRFLFLLQFGNGGFHPFKIGRLNPSLV